MEFWPLLPCFSQLVVPTFIIAHRAFFWDYRAEVKYMMEVFSLKGKSDLVGHDSHDTNARARMLDGRTKAFKAAAIAWCIAADFYFGILFCARDEGTSLFDWLCKPHIFGGIASTILMRICSRPSFYLTEGFLEKVLVFQLVVSAVCAQTMPAQMLPCLACCRMMIVIMFLRPSQALTINLVLLPISIAVRIGGSFDTATVLVSMLNELLCIFFTAISCCYVDGMLWEKVVSTIKMEAKSQEAEANMAAAKKLLNVTCDACVQLTHDFQITKPERAFLDILGGGEEVEGRSLLDYICPSDQQRWLDVADQLGAESPAKALSLRLETQDTSKEVRLYHVKIPTAHVDGDELAVEHLLGATLIPNEAIFESSQSSREPRDEDMKFLLGRGQPVSKSVPGSIMEDMITESQAEEKRLPGLEDVILTIDAMSLEDGFVIHSAEFNFDRAAEIHHLPNLMEWVNPEMHRQVFCWIQDHVNAFAAGKLADHHRKDSQLERVGMLHPSGRTHVTAAVKAIDVVTPTEEIQNDDNPETLANDNADNGSESQGEVLVKLCFRDFYKAC